MKKLALFGILAVAGAATCANAFEFQCRWVERVGNVDTVIGGSGATIDATDGAPRRIRLQFGVFDDGQGAAPAGGFIGWNVGTLAISGPAANSDDTRTPGRLVPFNFANGVGANGNPPLPGGDPFTNLTDIDATLGTQSPFWGFDGEGNPLPQPQPVIRGLRGWTSVYEITIDPATGGSNYTVTAGGNLVAADAWLVVGSANPPDPDSGTPGSVTYAPSTTAPVAFDCVLNVMVPAPGAAALLGLGGLVALRRRR